MGKEWQLEIGQTFVDSSGEAWTRWGPWMEFDTEEELLEFWETLCLDREKASYGLYRLSRVTRQVLLDTTEIAKRVCDRCKEETDYTIIRMLPPTMSGRLMSVCRKCKAEVDAMLSRDARVGEESK